MKLALALVFFAACGRSGGSECAARAARIGDSLAAADREGRSLIAMDAHLVEDRTAPLARGDGVPVVRVLATGIITVGTTHAYDARDVMDALSRAHPPRVFFAIDAGAAMGDVVNAERGAVSAGFTDAGILFTRPTALTTPAPSMLIHEIRGIVRGGDPSVRAWALSKIAVRVIHGCKELEDAAGAVRPANASDDLVAAIPGALTACGCSVDPDNVHDLMWMILAPVDHPPEGVVDVTLAPMDDASARAITGATWADAAPSVMAAGGQRIRFVRP